LTKWPLALLTKWPVFLQNASGNPRFDPWGESLDEGGPLAKTQKKVKKDSESLDVVDVCTR